MYGLSEGITMSTTRSVSRARNRTLLLTPLILAVGLTVAGCESDGGQAPASTPVVSAPDVPAPDVPAPAEQAPEASVSQQNAADKAGEYLSLMGFSRDGLVAQLEFDGFPAEDAQWAVDNIEVDWNEQAAKKAQEYMAVMSFSRTALIDQLTFDKFTPEQAEYGVSQTGL